MRQRRVVFAAIVRAFDLRRRPETWRVPGNRRMARRQRGFGKCAFRRSRLRDGDRQRRNARCNPRAIAGQNTFSRLRPSREFWFCGGEVCMVRAQKKLSRRRRTTWWLGTSSAVFRRTSFTFSSAARCRRNISRNCSRKNWNNANSEPRGELPAEHAAAIASRRGIYEVRAAHSPETTQHWCSKDSTAWTVVYEADARFQLSCLNRFHLRQGGRGFENGAAKRGQHSRKVSTVGIAAPEEKFHEIATQLARWGATRICPLGQMQNPPLTWRHDGRPGSAI
jgi:hypothetical protein